VDSGCAPGSPPTALEAAVPEGDTVRRTAARLHQALAGRDLVRTELRWAELGGIDLAGRTVESVTAYGKHQLLRLAAPASATPSVARVPTAPAIPLTVHSHLRMDGAWHLHATGSRPWPSADDPRIRAVLAGTEWTAVGHWLGMLNLVPTADEARLLGHLGPDIMADEFPGTGLADAVARLVAAPQRQVGAALLDQTMVAGIGTFYMAEALFAHRISPWTPVGAVDCAAVLCTARRQMLRGVLSPMPSTTGDTRPGQNSYVHGRSGRPCRRCGSTVRVAPIGDPPRTRPAFYCPTCQPGPTPTDDGRPRAPLGSAPARPYSLRNNGLQRRR
jgi:endonuclease-8